VSQLADRFVKDPSEVVKVGDKIKVRVLEVDLARKRISLSARSEAAAVRPSGPQDQRGQQGQGHGPRGPQGGGRGPQGGGRGPQGGGGRGPQGGGKSGPEPQKFANNPFANLLKR
jgi:uncharacterized protein